MRACAPRTLGAPKTCRTHIVPSILNSLVTQNHNFFLILRCVYCAEGGAEEEEEDDDKEEAAPSAGDHLRRKGLTGRSVPVSLVLYLEEEARGERGEAGRSSRPSSGPGQRWAAFSWTSSTSPR